MNAALIGETLRRNDLSDVELIVAGASDSAGSGVLRLDSEAGATSTLDGDAKQTFEEEHWGVSSKRIAVPLITIDEERSSRSSIDFLKVDVEGHEAAVLRGAERTISSDQPVILVECFHQGHACLKPLQDLGYRFVDGDRLTEDSQAHTSNYFGFPARFHELIDPILRSASERMKSQ